MIQIAENLETKRLNILIFEVKKFGDAAARQGSLELD
jgi:hypothetical protein